MIYIYFFLVECGCPGQLARTSTNPTGHEVNDHVRIANDILLDIQDCQLIYIYIYIHIDLQYKLG